MGLREGLHDSIGDIYVQAGEIACGAITVNILGACAVTTAKLQDSSVTTEKMDSTIGHVYKLNCAALGAGATSYKTFTATSACTIVDAVFIITALGTTGDLTLETTAAVTMIAEFVTTGVTTIFRATGMATLAAGASLELSQTASKTNTVAGRLVLTFFYGT